jgi:hypothetical protein
MDLRPPLMNKEDFVMEHMHKRDTMRLIVQKYNSLSLSLSLFLSQLLYHYLSLALLLYLLN